jgi:gamma-glutamyl-gamma-aminobutyrate hydrolase PuuD
MSKLSKPLDKVYCSYGHSGEANWILPLGFEHTSNIEEANLVLFGGGKDVDPNLYGERRGSRTCTPSDRDKQEAKDFALVQGLNKEGKNIKTIGICRGAQLICALSGGKVIQHVSNHCGTHSMSTFDRLTLDMNSIHHQMMFPYPISAKDYKILAWTTKPLSSNYLNGHDKPIWLPNAFKETEIIYFKKTDALGIQGHPEMLYRRSGTSKTMEWLQNLFTKFYNNQI